MDIVYLPAISLLVAKYLARPNVEGVRRTTLGWHLLKDDHQPLLYHVLTVAIPYSRDHDGVEEAYL